MHFTQDTPETSHAGLAVTDSQVQLLKDRRLLADVGGTLSTTFPLLDGRASQRDRHGARCNPHRSPCNGAWVAGPKDRRNSRAIRDAPGSYSLATCKCLKWRMKRSRAAPAQNAPAEHLSRLGTNACSH